MNQVPKLKSKTIILEENTEVNLCNFEFSIGSLDITKEAKKEKKKQKNWI